MGRSTRRIAVSAVASLFVVAALAMLITPAAATVSAQPTDNSSIPQASNGTATNGTVSEPAPEFPLSVTTSADRVVVGDPYVVEVTVRNVGNATGTKGVEFDAEGREVADQNVTLSPGASRTIRFTYRFSEPGNETVTVDYSVQRTVVVEPRRANLTVGNVTVEDDTVRTSEPVRFSATVTNDGRETGTRQVELVLFGDVVDVQSVTVAPGETERVTFTRRIDRAGTYTASIAGQEHRVRVRSTEEESPTPTETATTTPATGSAPGFGIPAVATALAALITALLVGRLR
jgi:hypothetical protein